MLRIISASGGADDRRVRMWCGVGALKKPGGGGGSGYIDGKVLRPPMLLPAKDFVEADGPLATAAVKAAVVATTTRPLLAPPRLQEAQQQQEQEQQQEQLSTAGVDRSLPPIAPGGGAGGKRRGVIEDSVEAPFGAGGAAEGHEGAVTCVGVAVLSDGTVAVVSGATDGVAKIWHANAIPTPAPSAARGNGGNGKNKKKTKNDSDNDNEDKGHKARKIAARLSSLRLAEEVKQGRGGTLFGQLEGAHTGALRALSCLVTVEPTWAAKGEGASENGGGGEATKRSGGGEEDEEQRRKRRQKERRRAMKNPYDDNDYDDDDGDDDGDTNGGGGGAGSEEDRGGRFWVATASNDKTVMVWDGEECGLPKRVLEGHKDKVVDVALLETGLFVGDLCACR